MPDFSATFTAGTTLQTWTDPADASRPSRLNPTAHRSHKRRVAAVGQQVTITATVAGVAGPLDAALGGRTFLCMLAEYPASAAITHPAGQTSVQSFTPAAAGHYTLAMRRGGGGGIIMHLDVE